MRQPRFKKVLEKSVHAALSAIEVYNKPDFKYREETFAILMINAWELVLKARLVKEARNSLKPITRLQPRQNRKGVLSKRKYPVLNRSGNPQTISVGEMLERMVADSRYGLTKAFADNIYGILEVRDNAIHFVNQSQTISQRVQELGTASLKNYIAVIQKWFQYDLSRYNFYLMPLAFCHGFETVDCQSVTPPSQQVKRFLTYVARLQTESPADVTELFNVAMRLETRFVKVSDPTAIPFQPTRDANAVKIELTEEDVLQRYPLDYAALTRKLVERYNDFKQAQKYHDLRKPLHSDPKYCKERLLDPTKPQGTKRRFYSPEVFKVFDQHYTKKP